MSLNRAFFCAMLIAFYSPANRAAEVMNSAKPATLNSMPRSGADMARPGPGPLMDSSLSDTQELTQELNRHLEDHHAHHRERRGTYAVGRFSAYWTVDASKTTFNMTMTGLTTGWCVLCKAFISITDTFVYSRAVKMHECVMCPPGGITRSRFWASGNAPGGHIHKRRQQ